MTHERADRLQTNSGKDALKGPGGRDDSAQPPEFRRTGELFTYQTTTYDTGRSPSLSRSPRFGRWSGVQSRRKKLRSAALSICRNRFIKAF